MVIDRLADWIRSLGGRRAHARAPSALAVDWRAFGSRVHHVTQVADLSPAGARLHALEPCPVGSPIVLDLATARGPVSVHGRVAWVGAAGMGVRFTRALAVPIA